MTSKVQKIRFDFAPRDIEKGLHVLEKDEDGKKKRYLVGISSGLNVDHHNERMSKNAIDSFQKQAESGEILLYPDVHGIKSTEDIGRLVKSEIDGEGNWVTHYCMYDGSEGAQPFQVEKANAMWNQICGKGQYAKPIQKGFSIEGIVPEGGIKEVQDDKGFMKRVIDNVELDGVVVVPRPAYKTSVAMAVYKALGEKPLSAVIKQARKSLMDSIKDEQVKEAYHSMRWKLESALWDQIDDIMKDKAISEKQAALEGIFDEYKAVMVNLIVESANAFEENEDDVINRDQGHLRRQTLLKSLEGELRRLRKSIIKEND